MTDALTAEFFNGLSTVGLCILAVVAFARGWVWTNAQVADLRADRDEWRKVAQTLAPVVEQTLVEAETANRLLRAMPHAGEVDR